MSYKDLENSIRASVEAFQSKVMVKANKKIEKPSAKAFAMQSLPDRRCISLIALFATS